MRELVAIVGPTATGKSDLALHLAQALDAEIVGADSRQVYRFMDIGTAKPTAEQRAAAPHHLIDVADPDEDFSLARYQDMALRAVEDIGARGRSALLVGGSGLYVWSVLAGMRIPHVPPDQALRRELEERAARHGYMALHQELLERDPEAAGRIDPRNVRRVVRALEVCQATGTPFSQLYRSEPLFRTLIIGLTMERDDLYHRIDRRVEDMMRRGLVAEVDGLVARGYGLDPPAMSSLGYRYIGRYLQGDITLDEAVQHTKHDTHRLARKQYAWFRPNDERIHWLDAAEGANAQARHLAEGFLAGERAAR